MHSYTEWRIACVDNWRGEHQVLDVTTVKNATFRIKPNGVLVGSSKINKKID